MMIVFNGPFASLLESFVELKRNTGFKYIKEAAYLRQFGNFCVSEGITEPVLTKELAEVWCEKFPHESGRNDTQQRITCLRQFALYLVSLGHKAYIPINQEHIRQRKSEFSVYVFTHNEMEAIFEQSNRIYPNRRSTMHLVLPVLVRLLYSSGLRIMEALNLQLKHVDFSKGIIRITNAKFDKDRHLPISDSMSAALQEYCTIMHPQHYTEDYLFVGISRVPLTHHGIYVRFRELLVMAGISHAGRGNGPRIHDIRYPNLNKIRTFRKKPDNQSESKEKGSDKNYCFIGRIPQNADRLPSALRHFFGADLSFSSSSVPNAFASCSVVISK